ncbi:MAG: SAF domain-containing protein, partial [Ilumatobacteraceae bacterium]
MTSQATRGAGRTADGADGADRADQSRGFQPSSRRRNRIAAGVLLAAVAIGGNALVYTNLNEAEPVVQVVRDVPAGAQITSDMLRTVDAEVDSTVNVIAGDQLDALIGAYAKVRLVSGSLVTAESMQSEPLVGAGSAVVAIQVTDGSLPIGLRERVPVLLVIPAGSSASTEGAPTSILGRVVGLPASTNSALGLESLSVEVARVDA